MARVSIAQFDSSPIITDSSMAGERVDPGVETRAVFAGKVHPVHSRLHVIPLGGRVSWFANGVGYVIYVWEGAVTTGRIHLDRGSMLLVEHGATASVQAEEGGSTLLVFNRPLDCEHPPRGAGGHIHILPADMVPRASMQEGVEGALFADSGCSSCELWLHENTIAISDYEVPLHSHSEDEIIVVTQGHMVLGRKHYGRGTAIAVKADTLYGFRSGPNGLGFINFRPSRPSYSLAGSKDLFDEQHVFRDKLGSPRYVNATNGA